VGNQPHAETPKTKLKYITYVNILMSEVSEVLKHAREREGKVDHEYEIVHTYKWIDIGKNGESNEGCRYDVCLSPRKRQGDSGFNARF
jgi:hypothetical protein